MSTTTNLSNLVINYLTQSQYDAAAQAGTLNENQIYLTPAVELATVATSGSYLDLSNKPTIPTKVSNLTNDSGFISSYTETDPVFSASAAAGITATDISNWNAKVSDTGKWNDVKLNKTVVSNPTTATLFVPILTSTTTTTGYLVGATYSPNAGYLAKYDNSKYLYSTTPSANDNSTKVATTAYVDNAVPKIHIIDLAYDDTIDGKSIYNSGDFTCEMVKDYIDNNELVILKMYQQFYYFDAYDRGTSDLTFVAQNFGSIGKDVLTPYKESGGGYSNKWCAFASDLPIYDGTVE